MTHPSHLGAISRCFVAPLIILLMTMGSVGTDAFAALGICLTDLCPCAESNHSDSPDSAESAASLDDDCCDDDEIVVVHDEECADDHPPCRAACDDCACSISVSHAAASAVASHFLDVLCIEDSCVAGADDRGPRGERGRVDRPPQSAV